MEIQPIINKLEEYVQIPSVVRYEDSFRNHLSEDFANLGCDIKFDERFLIISKKNIRNPKVLTAHIDRHGIVINSNLDFEYAAFNANKFYKKDNPSSEKMFQEAGKRFLNCLVYSYWIRNRLEEGFVKSFDYDLETKTLKFDVDGIKKLESNLPVSYLSNLKINGPFIDSQIDNAISIALIYQLVKDGYDGNIIFSTEEEIGNSWKYVLKALEKLNLSTKEIINLDTTPYTERDKIENGLVVLRNKDQHGVFNPNLVRFLKNKCDELLIPYEMKDEFIEGQNKKLVTEGQKPKKLGTTELGRIVEETKGDINGATIQIPTFNYHTNNETASIKGLENFYRLVSKVLSN
ncbi:MAG: hypothetical protein PHE43_01130 [Candidatus Nanoarchaeia archaeon]|nr:hypothetical protein [Candidatus Nanoarchaeia archaeon]